MQTWHKTQSDKVHPFLSSGKLIQVLEIMMESLQKGSQIMKEGGMSRIILDSVIPGFGATILQVAREIQGFIIISNECLALQPNGTLNFVKERTN
jgi:hypothetical protein